MTLDQSHFNGACHCGTVRFRVALSNGLHSARRCNCSLCRMRGAIAVSANLQDLNIIAGEEALTAYQFNTKTAKHYFCSRCGIYTHHQRRSNPKEFAVNVACLQGVSPFDFAEIMVLNGANHPKDEGGKPNQIAGRLSYKSED